MPSERDILKARLKDNIGIFGKVCLPTAYKKSTPPFHQEIYTTVLDKNNRRVLIAAPRGTAKSTLVSLILPVYMTMFKEENKDLFIMIISESRAQSINFLSRIKDHLEDSEPLRDIFGDFGENTAVRWREEDIILKNGTRIVALGTGNRIRGYITKDTRPDLIIMDDIESETNAATKEARAKNRKWVTEAVIPSLSDDGRVVMIGTVISEDCFLYWAKDSKVWQVLWFSIVKEDGTSIWKDKFPMSRIEEIKEGFSSVGNLNGFFQEYMNQAQSPENAPFKPDFVHLHPYHLKKDEDMEWYLESDTTGRTEEEIRKIPVDLFQGIDPASSLSQHADFFVIVTLAIDVDFNVYVADLFRKKIEPSKQPRLLIDKYKQFRPKKMKIETVAYQEALRSAVKALMIEEGLHIGGLERGVKPRQAKSERLLSLVPMMARGKFFFRPQDIEMQKEFLSYPRGKHDDCMDAVWTALQGAFPCRRKEINQGNTKKQGIKKYDWHV